MNPATPIHVLALSLHYAEPPSFSIAEMVLLAVLIVLSLIGFFWRFDRVLRNILTARKDPDFHLAPIGKRVWDFFWEVLCQAKVIRERPLPGLAHAFVFWGFCAFAWSRSTTSPPASASASSIPPAGFGRFYFYFAAVFAAACAVGIAGLFVRRFFVRPRWLGQKVSYESGFIALLIFVLMVTYLAAFVDHRRQPRRSRALVDAHALAADLPAPHSAHQASPPGARAPPPSFSRAAASARFRRSPAMKTSASSPART